MRILHFISSAASGGAEVYVKDLAKMLVLQGHSVGIVFLDRASENGRSEEYESHFIQDLNNTGVDTFFIGSKARKRLWFGRTQVRGILNRYKPDLIHCHLYYAILFCAGFDYKLVYTHHSNRLRLPKLAYRIIDKFVDAYIGICLDAKNLLHQASGKPVHLIDNAVDKTRLVERSERIDDHESVRLFAVGRLTEQKNYYRLLDALTQIDSSLHWSLNIAGEGRLRDELEEYKNTLNLADKVSFLGNVSNIPEYLGSSDVFVMSSDWEGLPIALIEATLSGLAVVVTNVGGCAEVVHKSLNGLVVDELTVDSFADALNRIVSDIELRKQFQKNSLKYSTDYLLEISVERHVSLYRSLVK